MNRISKQLGVVRPAKFREQVRTLNHDDYPAYKLPLPSEYLQMVMTNVLGNTFYASEKEQTQDAQQLHATMLRTDPIFMAKALVYARNNGYMRLQPIWGLAFLTTLGLKFGHKSHGDIIKRAYREIIKTPGDLEDFVTALASVRKGRGLGRFVKELNNDWLNRMPEYHAIKYGAKPSSTYVCSNCGKEYKQATYTGSCDICRRPIGIKTAWGLADIIKACHPNPEAVKISELFKYIIHGTTWTKQWGIVNLDVLPQVKCLETIKQLTRTLGSDQELTEQDYYKRVTALIEEGRLPYEIVTGIIHPTTQMWAYLMHQMPIFALLRHLNTLQKHNVLDSRENVDWVVSQLTNPNIVHHSKLWPSRIFSAYQHFEGGTKIKDALRDMADIALDNVPTIPGRTAVFVDVSGSMSYEDRKVHAAMLGLAAMNRSADAEFWCFDGSLHYPGVSTRDSILSNVDKIVHTGGGMTWISGCLEHLMGRVAKTKSYTDGHYSPSTPEGAKSKAPIKVDNIVIVTDEQQNTGMLLISKFREYRNMVNTNAKLFIVDVASYNGKHVVPGYEKDVYFIFGWSDEILRYISFVVNGLDGQMESVAKIAL